MKSLLRNHLFLPEVWFLIILGIITGFTAVGPVEKSLGSNIRMVYLHGAWVWAALFGFLAAAATGITGMLLHKATLHRWSRTLGRTGLFFWITYLPISLWAMQTNWNGLFLAEPRWRLALVFAIGGLIAQIGVTLLEDPTWASATNLVFVIALFLSLQNTQNVMHPASPILNSDARRIQLYFFTLLSLTLLAGWQVARWWHRFERQPARISTTR